MTTEDLRTPKNRMDRLGASQLDEVVRGWRDQETILRACRNAGTLAAVVKQMILIEEQGRTGASTGECLADWREKRWGGQVEQFFIANRRRFEAASFWRLIASSKGVAMEAYYRLCNRETTFEQLAEACKHAQEQGAWPGQDELPLRSVDLVEKKPLIRLAKNLAVTLRNTTPGITRPPIRQRNEFVVLQLRQWHPPTLDTDLRRAILLEIENTWLEKELERRIAQLNSPEDLQECIN